jgi:hypothetical protein
MPTTNFDASLLTQRKRSAVLYTWNRINQDAVNAGLSVQREQPNTQLATVVTYRHETAANTNPAPSAECPCTVSVNDNRGGNVANNVQ